jgi:hypothetical protein
VCPVARASPILLVAIIEVGAGSLTTPANAEGLAREDDSHNVLAVGHLSQFRISSGVGGSGLALSKNIGKNASI